MSIGAHFKGVPHAFAEGPLTAVSGASLCLLDDELMLPAAILKASALDNNARWMAAYAARLGVELGPHGKTTMSPELIRRQLAHGAWGITAATAHHVRLYASWGVKRIIMANQIVGKANIDAIFEILRTRSDIDFYCLVDSVASVAILADAATRHGLARPVQVLVELGGVGERTGARDVDAVIAVAQACAAHPQLIALRGVECFEGVYGGVGQAQALVKQLSVILKPLADAGLFAPGEVIVSAGGSAFFDVAASEMADITLGAPLRRVLRSGCYLTHDSAHYEALFEAAATRDPILASQGRLLPALEVWAHVQSRPEPTRVVASLGKRDVGNDVLPPSLVWHYRPGRDGTPQAAPVAKVAKIYDQHICLDVTPESDFAVGDLVGFGVSHPCTTFDKWRALFVVDDQYRVVDIVHTWF
jgi:D-serine dehydratase